jgi:hypothetical protein
MLSIKLFRLLFGMFRFNQNTKTLCFGIEAKLLNVSTAIYERLVFSPNNIV